jgi:hypothetical protein
VEKTGAEWTIWDGYDPYNEMRYVEYSLRSPSIYPDSSSLHLIMPTDTLRARGASDTEAQASDVIEVELTSMTEDTDYTFHAMARGDTWDAYLHQNCPPEEVLWNSRETYLGLNDAGKPDISAAAFFVHKQNILEATDRMLEAEAGFAEDYC